MLKYEQYKSGDFMDLKFDIGNFVDIRTEERVCKELVDRFKKRRKEAKMTQKQLSIASGVSYGSIKRFEQTGDISFRSLIHMAVAMGVLYDFDYLFTTPAMKSLKDAK